MKRSKDAYMTDLSVQEMQKTFAGSVVGVLGWFGSAILGGMVYDLLFHTEDVEASVSSGRDAARAKWGK